MCIKLYVATNWVKLIQSYELFLNNQNFRPEIFYYISFSPTEVWHYRFYGIVFIYRAIEKSDLT